ncbi:MAG TPA: patatin-like phospholipase family protein [Thermoanaerobaculia bacterium]|nr:patatin-like phospholipase family protein [Thermoanaerobaculia bacterium]
MPLELYQVLEEEYISMYGPLERPSSDYGEADVLDLRWALAILKECEIRPAAQPEDVEPENSKLEAAAEKKAIAAQLSALVSGDASLAPLADSPAITERGLSLIDGYDELKALAEERDSKNGVRELRRTIIDDALTGAVKPLCDVRLDGVYAALHARAKQKEKPRPRTALCISGGGIRSATFALGILQGLASANILDQFDYLSTVSGGGYIGSWLSSWARRHPRGASGVQGDLQRADNAVAKDPLAANLPQRKITPEPLPLRHLREYSNYLSPRLGLLSGDTWTMASLYIRNLLLNLLVLVPLLALALAFPRIFSWLLRLSAALDKAHWSSSIWAWATAGLIALGFSYLGWKRPVEQGQKKASSDGRFIVSGVIPLALAATSLAVFWARFKALSLPTQQHLLPLTQDQADLLKLALPAAVVALLSMTLLPFLLYYGRVATILPAAQRKVFAAAAERRITIGKKIFVELLANLVALGTAAALLWLLAEKVFNDPLRLVPTVETLAPIARAGLPASPQAQLYVCFIVPLLLLVFFVQASIFVGLSSLFNEDYDREWWGRAGAWLLAGAAGLALFNAAAVFGPVAFYYAPVILASIGGGAGIASALLGFSSKTPANQREKEEGGMKAKTGNFASALTVPLFLVALLAAISLGSTWIAQQFPKGDGKVLQVDHYAQEAMLQSRFTRTEDAKAGLTLTAPPLPRVSLPALRAIAHLQTIEQTDGVQVLIFLAVAAFGFGLSFFIGVNKFSMHALYRNRIIRAYLGASRYFRDPDRFTGFDENDNIKMWELRPEFLWSASLHDAEGLVAAFRTPENALGAYLWEALEKPTREALEAKIDPVSTVALVENLNDILVTHDLARALRDLKVEGLQPPAWTATTPGQIGYSRTMINRAILDDRFGAWITPMTPPADAAPASGLRRGPLHVVNTALNLTSGDNLAWQQRMAESFTMSPYHTGSLFLGYRASKEYGGGISLGTAVTISGAAASPNMGYHSSPIMAFLLTFFNIRLGSWLGNSGPRGQKVYQNKHPTTGLATLFKELTGTSNDASKWVYLSDGGHFENLGLYEMVLRRCHRIVLSDGGADPKYSFEDLGNAIRKIRTDFGIPIDIAKITMAPRAKDGKPVTGEYTAIGTIRYSAVDKDAEDGQLIYIKPGVYEGDYFPWDVYNYSQESLQFPHEPTSDQFFSESQFESYRALGRHAINTICKNYPPRPSHQLPVAKTYTSIAEFADSVKEWSTEEPSQIDPDPDAV